MSLVSTLEILSECVKGNYAVGAFNINSLDQPQHLIKKAEELKSPLLIVVPGVIEKYVNFEDYAYVTARAARDASVPVGIHLSHGNDLEQFERACKAGFTSVMYDGSKLPYEENIENTKRAVEIGRRYGCAVEGELGALATEIPIGGDLMTDPELAKDFVSKTGVDILAVAIGNAHGFYKGTPNLDFERLKNIHSALSTLDCYLTLHGGTGIPEKDIKKSIEQGISKVCIYTEMCNEGKKDVIEYLKANPTYTGNYDIPEMLLAMMNGFSRSMEECMNMFMSVGKATYEATSLWDLTKYNLGDYVPVNTDIGPSYPSEIALNDKFIPTGKYWNNNV